MSLSFNPDRYRRTAREVKAPVREERPVDEIIETLSGAARDAWLNKWRRWIAELIDSFNLEDPQEIGYDERYIEDFLIEHCSGLVESECFSKIKQMVVEKSAKHMSQDVSESFSTWYEYVKKDPRFLCQQFSLSVEVCDEVLKIAKNPCIDRGLAERILRSFFENEVRKMGVEPREEMYRDALNSILVIIPQARCIDWQHVLVAQVSLDRWIKRAVKRVERFEKMYGVGKMYIYTLQELAKETRSDAMKIKEEIKSLGEAYKIVVDWIKKLGYRYNEVKPPVPLEFFTNATYFYLPYGEPICRVEEDARGYKVVHSCGDRVIMLSEIERGYFYIARL